MASTAAQLLAAYSPDPLAILPPGSGLLLATSPVASSVAPGVAASLLPGSLGQSSRLLSSSASARPSPTSSLLGGSRRGGVAPPSASPVGRLDLDLGARGGGDRSERRQRGSPPGGFAPAVQIVGKMRISERLNVVRINASNANGRHNNSELLLPQDEPAIETQTIGEDDIHVEQQDYDDLNVSGEDGEVQKRGTTLLPHVWDLPAGERIVVKCNRFGQPIGREGGVLGQFLGTVARNGGYCPLDKKDWRLVKRNGGDETILDFVKTKFLYPRPCEKWILKSVGRDWKQYKAALKKALFNVKKKRAVLYRRCAEDVDDDQWVALVNHWKSKKGKTQSEKNKRSISIKKRTHTAGTKSYARWAEDMRQADPQKQQPHRAEVYLATHRHKGEQRNEHVDKLEEIMEEQPELGQNDQGKVAWEGDALHIVLGQENPGQVHGMGLLPVPKQAYGKKSHLFKDIYTTTVEGPLEITVLEEMGKLKERIEKQDQIIEDLRNKQSSHVNREPEEVNCEATYEDNFQLRHSKRKRIVCDVPVQDSLSEQQEFTKNKAQEQVTQNKIPRRASSKKARPAAMTVGTIVVLKSAKYPNKEPVAYATLLSCDPDAEVDGVKLGNQFWKMRINFLIEGNEVLVRPWHHYKTIDDAKGKIV